MKTILFILLLCTPAFADVYVITAPDKTVVSLSEQDDAVMPEGYSKDIIKNKMIVDLPIDGDVTLYKFNGNKFSIDGVKVTKKRKNEEDAAVAIEKRKADRASGIEKLKTVAGLTDAEVSELIGG
jgi:hypothetical protein